MAGQVGVDFEVLRQIGLVAPCGQIDSLGVLFVLSFADDQVAHVHLVDRGSRDVPAAKPLLEGDCGVVTNVPAVKTGRPAGVGVDRTHDVPGNSLAE